MKIPASDLFASVSLAGACNGRQSELPEALESPAIEREAGPATIQGMPFDLGPADGPNIILLADQPVTVELGELTATYIIFLHVVAERFCQMRATLEGAYNRLHQRMHRQGLFHQHTPLHDHPGHDK